MFYAIDYADGRQLRITATSEHIWRAAYYKGDELVPATAGNHRQSDVFRIIPTTEVDGFINHLHWLVNRSGATTLAHAIGDLARREHVEARERLVQVLDLCNAAELAKATLRNHGLLVETDRAGFSS